MIDYSYVECTSACVTALALFLQSGYTDYRYAEVKRAIEVGRVFLYSIQREDGSWYGSWGVCFTYGTWFGIEGLLAAGETPSGSKGIKKAVTFLLSKQREDGGWGESYVACVDKAYPADGTGFPEGSGVVQTAWALLGLLAGNTDKPQEIAAIHRAAEFLMKKQLEDGDWAQEAITGVFN
eukprot:gene32021-41213_t